MFVKSRDPAARLSLCQGAGLRPWVRGLKKRILCLSETREMLQGVHFIPMAAVIFHSPNTGVGWKFCLNGGCVFLSGQMLILSNWQCLWEVYFWLQIPAKTVDFSFWSKQKQILKNCFLANLNWKNSARQAKRLNKTKTCCLKGWNFSVASKNRKMLGFHRRPEKGRNFPTFLLSGFFFF